MDHYYIFNAQVSNLIDQNGKCNNQQKEECTTPKVFSFVFLLQHYFYFIVQVNASIIICIRRFL